MSDTLVVNEIYFSLQGESTLAGLPCVFIRLTGCHLRCSYCDTAYAFREGERLSLKTIRQRVRELGPPRPAGNGAPSLPLVELTGGEPLLQENAPRLMEALCDDGFTVLLETSGARSIAGIDSRVRRIMDLKCPGSGEADRNRWANLDDLRATDEIKFVIATEEDYTWAKQVVEKRKLTALCPVLFSWAEPLTASQQDPGLKPAPAGHRPMSRRELAERVIADRLPVRFQLQMHKFIWPPDQPGV